MEQANIGSNSSNNTKKNILLWFLVVFAALTVVLFSISCVKKFVEKDKITEQNQKQESVQKDQKSGLTALSDLFPKVECSFKNDEEAYNKSIENLNINICKCIKEANIKEKCEKTYFSSSLYTQAIRDRDIKKCDLINNQTIASACKKIVESKIKFLEGKE